MAEQIWVFLLSKLKVKELMIAHQWEASEKEAELRSWSGGICGHFPLELESSMNMLWRTGSVDFWSKLGIFVQIQ